MTNKKPLIISFSGGRTSAYMTFEIMSDVELLSQYEPFIVFANTGLEHEKTLEFIHNCEINFGWRVIWLEAVVQPEKGKGTRHKIVNFETAARNGEPFRAMVEKYTLPNVSNRHCTRETKLRVIESWSREWFGTTKIDTAVGIRIDEQRRVSGSQDRKIIYPLIDRYFATKDDVLEFWATMPFDLEIPDYLGNCVPCFHKSDTKLLKALQDEPRYFAIVEQIAKDYPLGSHSKPAHFYRYNRDVSHIRALLGEVGGVPPQIGLDFGGCSESCEFLSASE